MSRVARFLAFIDDPNERVHVQDDAVDHAILSLLVHLAYSDGVVQDDELALLCRLRPDLDVAGLMDWAAIVAERTFDARVFAAVIVDPADRWTAMRIASRMVCMDGDVADEEMSILHDLAEVFDVGTDAPEAAVAEIVARGGPVSRDRVSASLRNMLWDVVTPVRDEPVGGLVGIAPDGASLVCTMLVGGDEVAALYFEGLAAVFESGARFVPWSEIVTYTRIPVPGASFHLRTATTHLKMSDPRMRDVGQLLDFIYGRTDLPE